MRRPRWCALGVRADTIIVPSCVRVAVSVTSYILPLTPYPHTTTTHQRGLTLKKLFGTTAPFNRQYQTWTFRLTPRTSFIFHCTKDWNVSPNSEMASVNLVIRPYRMMVDWNKKKLPNIMVEVKCTWLCIQEGTGSNINPATTPTNASFYQLVIISHAACPSQQFPWLVVTVSFHILSNHSDHPAMLCNMNRFLSPTPSLNEP